MADAPQGFGELGGVYTPEPGEGTSTPMKPTVADWQHRMVMSRINGASWEDIHQVISDSRQRAIEAGHSPADVDAAMGYGDASEVMARMKARAQANAAANPLGLDDVQNPFEGFRSGLKASSGGILVGEGLPDHVLPTDAGMATRLAYHAGTLLGDLPAMVTGAVAGGAAGSLAGPGVGTAIGAGSASFALPEAIKQEYSDALLSGAVKGPQDFAERQSAVWWNVAKQAVVGAWFGLAGVGAEAGAAALGASKGVQIAAKSSAELATMVGAGAAVQGQLPSFEDLTDAAILTATMHGVMKLNPANVRTTSANLMRNWVQTGEAPAAAAQRAMSDILFHQDLMLPHPSEPPLGSSESPTSLGNFVLPADSNPVAFEGIDAEGTARTFTGPHDLNKYLYNKWVPMGEAGALPREAVLKNGQIVPASGSIAGYLREFGEKAGFSFITPTGGHTVESGGLASFYQGFLRPRGKYAFVTVPEADAGTRWMGLGRYEILYHEVGHALDDKLGLGGGSGATPVDYSIRYDAMRAEMEASSRRFRPDFWDPSNRNSPAQSGYVLKSEELMADNVALWISDPTARKDMPLFTAKFGHLLQPYVDIANKYLPVLHGDRWQAPPPGAQGGEPAGTDLGPRHGGGKPPPGAPPLPPLEGPTPEPSQGQIEMDPWLKASARFAPQDQGPGWGQRIKNGLSSFYREMFRPDHPLNQIQDAFENGVRPLADFENPNFLRRIAENGFSRAVYMIREGMIKRDPRTGQYNVSGPALRSIFEPFDSEAGNQKFDSYLLAARTVDLNKAALRSGRAPESTGLELKDALQIMREGKEKYGEAAEAVKQWRNGTLEYAIGHGISRDTYNLLTRDGFANMPLYRREEIDMEHAGGTGPGKLGGTAAQKMKGSDLLIEKPEVSLMKDAFRRVQQTDNNAANQALTKIAEPLGLATKVREAKVTLDAPELLQIAGAKPGLNDDEDSILRHVLEKKLGWTFKNDEVPVWQNGGVEVWHFFDPNVTRFIKGMDTNTQFTYQRVLASMANVQRRMIVTNPFFPVRLLTYDVPWQFITKPGMQNVLQQAYLGISAVFNKGDMGGVWQEWLRNGGADRVFQTNSANQYIKDVLAGKADPAYSDGVWNAVNTPYRALQSWGQNMSQIMRVGRYAQLREAGATPIRSAAASTEAAFHRANFGGPATKAINAVQPFFAAYLNSLEQTARGMFGIGKTLEGKDFNALQFSAKAIALVTLPMLGSWWANKDEEWYKGAPDWQKDNGILFHVGDYTGYIPLPPVLGFLYGGLPRRMMEAFAHDNPHALDNLVGSFGASFLPPVGALASSAVTPLIEKVANYSFFRGHQLTPDSMKGDLPPEQFTPWSTRTAQELSKFFSYIPLVKNANLNPIQIDNFIQGWGGTLGAGAVRATEMAYNQARQALGYTTTAPSPHLSEWPLLSSWMSRYPSANNAQTTEFYQRMDLNKQYHGSLESALSRGDLDRFKELAHEDPAATMVWRLTTKMPVPGGADQFIQTLKEARDPEKIGALRGVIQTEKALTQLHTVIKFVGGLPNSAPLTAQERGGLAQSMQALGYDNKPGMISANDKRQILDQAYTMLQKMSERGLDSMNKAGMK